MQHQSDAHCSRNLIYHVCQGSASLLAKTPGVYIQLGAQHSLFTYAYHPTRPCAPLATSPASTLMDSRPSSHQAQNRSALANLSYKRVSCPLADCCPTMRCARQQCGGFTSYAWRCSTCGVAATCFAHPTSPYAFGMRCKHEYIQP